MLSRHGTYVPPNHVDIPPPEKDEAGDDKPNICQFCQSNVFSAASRYELRPEKEKDLGTFAYSRQTNEFHQSVLEGCMWCTGLVRGVLSAAHLDYWYEQWDGSHSDGSSMLDEGDEDAPIEEVEVDQSDVHENSLGTMDQGEDDLELDLASQDQDDLTLSLSDFARFDGHMSVAISLSPTSEEFVLGVLAAKTELSWNGADMCKNKRLSEMKGDTSIRLTFETSLVTANNCSSHGGLSGINLSLESHQWFQLAKSWLANCSHHSACSLGVADRNESLSTIPTMLIDLTDPLAPRLVYRKSVSQQNPVVYATLSYVWGKDQPYALTQDTLKDKLIGLDISLLPKTIADGIKVTLRLGYSYLWVDALCIIQDSGAGKLGEISRMDQIYAGSALTIVAANSSAATDGIFKNPDDLGYFIEPFKIPLGLLDDSLILGYRSYYKPSRDPINSRAWTLQERILSPRCLIYAHDGLKWKCKACEENPNGPPDAPTMFPLFLFNHAPASDDGPVADDSARQCWLDIRAEYTSRKMTNPNDKLVAISAIALQLSKANGWTYLAGLWKEYLILDLQWQRSPEAQSSSKLPGTEGPGNLLLPRPAKYRAPSWSWASVDGQVVSTDDEVPQESFHFEVVSCVVTYTGVSQPSRFNFEPIESGVLTVKGLVLECRWCESAEWDLTDFHLLDPQSQEQPYIYGEGIWDALEPVREPRIYCLAISVETISRRKRHNVEGLVLVPCKGEVFRRIGFFEIYNTASFDGAESQILRIV